MEEVQVSKYLKKSVGFSLAAAIVLSSQLAEAQQYGGYPAWNGGPPPVNDYGYGANPRNQRAEQDSPAALLREGVEKLTQILEGRPNRAALTSYIDSEVAPWFDFNYMAAWAAGRRFQYMNETQQDELVSRIKQSFLDKMVQKLSRYGAQRALFLPALADGPGQMTLPVSIENPGGYPSHLEFHMRQTDKGWKVIDVSANGMSALLHYRQVVNEMMGQQRPPQPRY